VTIYWFEQFGVESGLTASELHI